jgi:hypothetical protein
MGSCYRTLASILATRSDAGAVTLLVLVAVLFFLPAAGMSFAGDDFSDLRFFYLIFNGHGDLACRCLTSAYMDPSFGLHYRPFLFLPQVLEWCLFGANSFFLHLTGVLFHALNTMLAFAAGYRIFRILKSPHAFAVSFWSAILFAIHPFHAEAVNLWCANAEIFFSSWYLVSLWCFAEWLQSGSRILFAVSAFCCLFALGTKETAVTLPAVLTILSLTVQGHLDRGKIFQSVKEVLPFWIVLAIFWALRSCCLGTMLGGYLGTLTTDWMGTLSERFLETNVLQVLFYPLVAGGTLSAGLGICLALLYLALAGLQLLDFCSRKAESRLLTSFLFALAFTAVSLLPVFYVWYPSTDLNGSRLLYLPCLGICWLICLVLFAAASSRVSPFRYLIAVALAGVLACSLLERHVSWISASRLTESLLKGIRKELVDCKKGQHLVLLTLPNRHRGVSVIGIFKGLQDALKKPFADGVAFEMLDSLEPHYYGDTTVLNLSRLRRLVLAPERYKVLDCRVTGDGNSVCLSPVDLSGLADRLPTSPLELSGDCITGAKEAGGASFTVLLPHPVKSAHYQFLKIKFRSGVTDRHAQLRVFWKGPAMKTFSMQMSRAYSLEQWQNRNEIVVHTGELLGWLRCPDVDSLALTLAGGFSLQSVSLIPEGSLVPRFQPAPGRCRELVGGVLLPDDGRFDLDFDVSDIPGACAVRAELTPPQVWLSSYSRTYRDYKFSQHVEKIFELKSARGTLSLTSQVAGPLWRQVRIMAVSADGRPLGYSSDPLYLQSGVSQP